MLYRRLVKKAIGLVALVNLAIQVMSVLGSLKGVPALDCLPPLPEPLMALIELGKTDYGRIILIAGFATTTCGLRLLLSPIGVARETGLAMILLTMVVFFAALPDVRLMNRAASCSLTVGAPLPILRENRQ
ncbi:MAG: hypothetical protein WBX25_04945 [Rhodomicrobium sp.]